ncbi:MAG: hypothetical protein GY730_06890, partial [bacterium]|nr:hypothetical protein [bacterium]
MRKKLTETVVNTIPDILKNALNWAKDNFDKHAQETLGSATGTVGIVVKLLGQSLIDGYFEKQSAKRLDNFGLLIYKKAALMQANKSVEAIEDELQREVSPKEVLELLDSIFTEQIEQFNPSDVLLIFQPKYHPSVVIVKNYYLRMLQRLGASQAAINAF